MSLKQMLKTLMKLGLSKADAQVYIFLAAKAPQKATDIAEALKMKNQQLYSCLRKLQGKGVVNCTDQHPKLFSAMPIEEVLGSFISANLEEAQHMEKNREAILFFWRTIVKENTHNRE